MRKTIAIFFLTCLVTACSITSKPLTVDQRYNQATQDIKQLFAEQTPAAVKMDYYQAVVRCMKYNLDYRIKLVNVALQTGQLDIATYTMFPALNMTGSLYTRNNDFSSSGITGDGISTGLSSSTPRTLRSARVGLSWNLLDFGMGYVRAKQQSERVLIAEEEARRQLQQLGQDVLVAYWSAYSAQKLISDTKEFQALLTRAKNKLVMAVRDKTIPKESILNYQAALLDGSRRLIQLQYKYDKAMSDLKHLLFLPLDEKLILAPPPSAFLRTQNLKDLDIQKLDAVTLVSHPGLRGQNYQERIAKFGVKTVLLQALPGITLNYGWNYNSNQFLLNKVWLDRSMDVAWNLLNLASLPTSYQTAKLQVKYEQIKLMALTMAALTETRYAFLHYQTLRNEYLIAHKQSENSEAIYQLNKNRQLASLASDQQVILAKLRLITAKMDEDLLMSDLSTALGQLYLSVGIDILPEVTVSQPLPVAIETLKKYFSVNNTADFKFFINHTYETMFVNKPGSYTLQLFGSYKLDDVKSLQSQFKTKSKLTAARTTRNGRDWYVLTYGKFTSINQAKSTTKKLPQQLGDLEPWVRKTDGLTWVA